MIALYPGAFKPPHRGHFEVVKRLLKGNHGGHIYNKDSGAEAGAKALAGQKGKVEKINKVIVFPGGGERNGITKGESMAIWKIYAKYLPGIEVRDGEKNPMFAAKDYAAANEDEQFYAVTGIRDESDFADLKRITTFKNVNNVEGLLIPSSPGDGVRATDLRKAALEGNLDDLRDFFPKELNRQELLTILKMLKDNVIAEIMNQKMEDLFEAMFTSEEVNEGSSGTPLGNNMPIRSEDKAKLVTLYNRIRHQVETPGVKVTFHQDHIRVGLENEAQRSDFDFTPFMASILEYMIDEGMKITPLPEIKIKKDLAESEDFFGKTAYYDPNKKEVVLYVQGRHPKDVMRSFTHEMIHHIQNLEGRLGNISTSNTNEDEHLLEIEKEAYLQGNITFRNWEDKVKNMTEDKDGKKAFSKEVQLSEESYKSEVLGLSRDFINVFKDNFGKKFEHNSYGNLPGTQTTEFEVDIHVKPVKDLGGHPYSIHAEGDEDTIEIWVEYIKAAFPAAFNDFIAEIKEAFRHEMEHVAQHVKGTAPFEAHGKVPFYKYLLLTHEIPAYVQGLRTRARTKKITLEDAIDQYFKEYTDSFSKEEEKEIVKKQWLDWASKNK